MPRKNSNADRSTRDILVRREQRVSAINREAQAKREMVARKPIDIQVLWEQNRLLRSVR